MARLDVIGDFEQLQRILVGRTINNAEMRREAPLQDVIVVSLDDGTSIRIDTLLMQPVEVEAVPK